MVFINEWLPNPVGPDPVGEFIELYNTGGVSISVRGWKIVNEKGKKFELGAHVIEGKGYVVLRRPELTFALRNTDENLSLYDSAGHLVDSARFLGSAPSGKSFSRVNYATEDITHFAFVDPTPGASNHILNTAIAAIPYPTGMPLNEQLGAGGFLALLFGVAALLTGFIIYIMERNEDLSELFFERY